MQKFEMRSKAERSQKISYGKINGVKNLNLPRIFKKYEPRNDKYTIMNKPFLPLYTFIIYIFVYFYLFCTCFLFNFRLAFKSI